jgi:hypothetical protein
LVKKTAHLHLHHRVAQKALRLCCVRSICCGALHHVKKTPKHCFTSLQIGINSVSLVPQAKGFMRKNDAGNPANAFNKCKKSATSNTDVIFVHSLAPEEI